MIQDMDCKIRGATDFRSPVNPLLTILRLDDDVRFFHQSHADPGAVMLFLAFAFVISPLIFENKLVCACLFGARTIAHLLVALILAIWSFGLVLQAMVNAYAFALPLAEVLYGIGFACATFLSVCVGSMVAPRWLTRGFAVAAAGLAAMFPAGLFLQHGLAGDWRPVFLWYLAGSLAGSVSAVRLVSRTAGHQTALAGA